MNDNKTQLRPQIAYKRQYLAAINNTGEKEVWVNCFCGDSNNWRKQIVSAADGGNCYFKFTVNLTTKNYYNFSINCKGG